MFDPRDKSQIITDNEVIDILEAFNEAEDYLDSHQSSDDIANYFPED